MKYYCIVNKINLTRGMIEESLNKESTIRFNNEGSRALLIFNTAYPDSMLGYKKFTHKEIKVEINTAEWIDRSEIPTIIQKIIKAIT